MSELGEFARQGATAARLPLVSAARERWANDPALGTAVALAAALAVGLLGGFIFAASPLVVAGGLVGAVALLVIVGDPRLVLYGAVLIIALLPFGVLPLPLGGVQLTFLEAALGLALGLWFVRAVLAPRERLQVTPVGGFVLVFLAITAIAFVNGTAYGFSMADARQYFKSLLGVLTFFTVLNCLRGRADGRWALLTLVGGGALAGVIGIAIYVLPTERAVAVLSSLGRLGYPTGAGILRFHVESERLRAVGTSIDPNAFGALLMVVTVVVVGQLVARAPALPRRWLWAALAPLALALLLTLSRSSWVGAGAGIALALLLRYPRLWPVFPAGLLLGGAILVFGLESYLERLPVLGEYIAHLFTGLRVEDQATAMRLGEYKDALNLIAAYPWLGVGYGNAPSVGLYVGVSSLYLLLAENAGLVGLASYLLAVAAVFWWALRPVWRGAGPELKGLVLSYLAALAAALVAGLFDHPFINVRFPHLVALFWLCAGLAVQAADLEGSE